MSANVSLYLPRPAPVRHCQGMLPGQGRSDGTQADMAQNPRGFGMTLEGMSFTLDQ